jgi:uncharacterized LabA/DUF88 family protein
MRSSARIAVFIDGQNLYQGCKSNGWQLDYQRFYRYLCEKYKATCVQLLLGNTTRYQKLYLQLKRYGYQLVFKPVTVSKRGIVKGNIDADLVFHCMRQYQEFDQAIIVSGDGDFYCLLQYLEQNNKLLKILVPNTHFSSLLREFAPKIIHLSSLKWKLQKKEAFPRDKTLR